MASQRPTVKRDRSASMNVMAGERLITSWDEGDNAGVAIGERDEQVAFLQRSLKLTQAALEESEQKRDEMEQDFITQLSKKDEELRQTEIIFMRLLSKQRDNFEVHLSDKTNQLTQTEKSLAELVSENKQLQEKETQTAPEDSGQESDILVEFKKRYDKNEPLQQALERREENFKGIFSRQEQDYERKLALQKHELKMEMKKRMNQVYEETMSLMHQIPAIKESFELQLKEKDRNIDSLRCQRNDLSALCTRQQTKFAKLIEKSKEESCTRCVDLVKELNNRDDHFKMQLTKQAEMLLEGLCKKCWRKKEKGPQQLMEESTQEKPKAGMLSSLKRAFGFKRKTPGDTQPTPTPSTDTSEIQHDSR